MNTPDDTPTVRVSYGIWSAAKREVIDPATEGAPSAEGVADAGGDAVARGLAYLLSGEWLRNDWHKLRKADLKPAKPRNTHGLW